MKLNQLRNVSAIASRGSLRAAARALGLSQPALTRSVTEIEHELGAPLFERRARGMALTPIGEAVVKRANVILNEVRRTQEEVDQIRGGLGGSVTAGLSIAAHIAMLPRSLKLFRQRYPDVKLRLIEGFYPTLESSLIDGSVDFYIGPQPSQATPKELLVEKLFDNTRTVLGRAGHPLANARSLRELVDAEWVMTSITHKADEEMDTLFARNGLPPPTLVIQTQSALTLIMTLAYSDMLAMVPIQWTELAITSASLVSINVSEPLPAPPMVLVRRTSLPLTPAAQFFADQMQNSWRKAGPLSAGPT
ncbi:DNA-binding transcriptional LysR family regulator [Rhodoligotrophos appendicifer]|uniref:LysR substrate-binding domain-containing protein n=1 Tax=Rhodoligotrophos appendicifer TaxID=987056 RepID=UPI0011869DB4|nr:LysR substrate-binding domain-containing protein [Rhodoligotrophos appendicifer]